MNENRVVVSNDEQNFLIDWTNENHNLFTLNSNASGHCCHINKILDLSSNVLNNEKAYKIINEIKDRIT